MVILLLIVSNVSAFQPRSMKVARFTASTTTLSMNFFDGLFGKKRSASAAHILVKGSDAKTTILQLKQKIVKSENYSDLDATFCH